MVDYYYAEYNENFESFMGVKRAKTLNNARRNLVAILLRENCESGAIASNPVFFKNYEISERYFVGSVHYHGSPDDPYLFYWAVKGKNRIKDMKIIRKDGSVGSTR